MVFGRKGIKNVIKCCLCEHCPESRP